MFQITSGPSNSQQNSQICRWSVECVAKAQRNSSFLALLSLTLLHSRLGSPRRSEVCHSSRGIISANTEPAPPLGVSFVTARVKYQHHLWSRRATWQHAVVGWLSPGIAALRHVSSYISSQTHNELVTCPGSFPSSGTVHAGRGSGSSWPWTGRDGCLIAVLTSSGPPAWSSLPWVTFHYASFMLSQLLLKPDEEVNRSMQRR